MAIGTWTKRIGVWAFRTLNTVALLFLLSVLTLAFTPVGQAVNTYLMRSTPLAELPKADAIVVLGGDPFRAADALRVYRAGKAPLIILSGECDEALEILEAGQVPRSAVRIDTAPLRTIDHPRTIRSVADIDDSTRLILITSMLHQRRALNVFRRAGYDHVWVCSMEWELHCASDDTCLAHDKVPAVFYEAAARLKSWVID